MLRWSLTRVFKYFLILTIAISITQAYAAGNIKGKIQAKGLRKANDIAVYLKNVPGSYSAPKTPILMDQKEMLFVPHILPVLLGTTVNFLNSEVKIEHNVFTPDTVANKFNLGNYPPGQGRNYTFDKPCSNTNETCVVTILCRVHPEMSAYILVLQNPYFAVTDKNGLFEISNIPKGNYEIVAWHEKLGETKQTITINEGSNEFSISISKK